jgi:hypothetical protein
MISEASAMLIYYSSTNAFVHPPADRHLDHRDRIFVAALVWLAV